MIHPSLLVDAMLLAEYVEIKMFAKFVNKYPKGFIPKEYTLNKGHMSFFRDKVEFVYERYKLIVEEMVKREFTLNIENIIETLDLLMNNLCTINWNDYKPTEEAINLNKERIIDRIKNPLRRKKLHTYYGKPIKFEEYLKIIK